MPYAYNLPVSLVAGLFRQCRGAGKCVEIVALQHYWIVLVRCDSALQGWLK
jgi:hypothetical protein